MINKIHDIDLNSWDRIHLSWACGQYFAYTYVHEKRRMITEAYYAALLDRLVAEIKKKQPDLKKKILDL